MQTLVSKRIAKENLERAKDEYQTCKVRLADGVISLQAIANGENIGLVIQKANWVTIAAEKLEAAERLLNYWSTIVANDEK